MGFGLTPRFYLFLMIKTGGANRMASEKYMKRN